MNTKYFSWLLFGGVIISVLLYAGILLYFTWPISEYSIKSSGVFGDSFGVLTALFSGLAFAGLIITIQMQREELKLQREELSLTREELKLTREEIAGQKKEMETQNATLQIQRFENTYFKMLEYLVNCRDNVSINVGSNILFKGQEAIKRFYDYFAGSFHGVIGSTNYGDELIAVQTYQIEYEEKKADFGSYYSTLYNIIKFINDDEDIKGNPVYANLVKAQLSRYELLLLFYHCLSDNGKEELAPLVKEYKIINHLEENKLPKQHIEIWNKFKAESEKSAK